MYMSCSYLLVSHSFKSIFSIIMSIIKATNDVKMTLLVHLLQYRLHLLEITNTDTKNNNQYLHVHVLPIQLSVHH